MGKILEIYLAKKDQPESSAYAALSFPAAAYQIQDAFDKLRLTEGEALYWEITEYYQFEELSAVLNDTCGLYDLNALAQKLSELDETQRAAFSGLLAMEQKTKRPLPITRLIDLAYSTDCCHVASDALNDSQLGRIRAESGCVPGVDNLPRDIFEMLDFERIGRNIRISENGVFVERSMDHPGGYVARHAPLLEVAKTLDLTPKAPDYTILLEVFHDSGAVQLKLPASSQDLDGIPQTLDEPDWLDLSWRCLDCKAPSLADVISEARDIWSINDFAEMLSGINNTALVSYKALLEASSCQDILRARLLAIHLSDYIFSPRFSSPAELAKEELFTLLREPSAETILPHVDLQKYGEALIKQCGGELTGYGLIERIDGHPIQSPRQGGTTLAAISRPCQQDTLQPPRMDGPLM